MTNLHSLALIDTATNVAESLPIGDLPRQLHITGDGKRAYLTDFGHQAVWVLDPVNKAIITTIELGTIPEALALSAEEDFLYRRRLFSPKARGHLPRLVREQPEPSRLITGHLVSSTLPFARSDE